MVISMEEYTSLRHEFLKVAEKRISAAALAELKYRYSDPINSVRVSDSIKDIEGLLRILEKRGVVRYDCILPLKHIAEKYMSNSGINARLEEYDTKLKNYIPRYPPRTNLYQIGNGESFLHNSTINHLSYSPTVDPRARFIIDNDLSDCNNCPISMTSNNKPEPFIKHGFRGSSDETYRDNLDIEYRDCNLEILPYESRKICKYDLEKLNEKVVSQVMIPPVTSNIESEGNKPSATEDLDKTEDVPETLLLTTPQSVEPENLVHHACVNNSISKEDSKINRRNFKRIWRRKYVRIFLVLPLVIVIILLIVYGFLKNPVHPNPLPSAPAPSPGWIQASNNPYAVPTTSYNGNTHPECVTPQPMGITQTFSLQTLSAHETKVRDVVFERVSQRLGAKWSDAARCLGVRESDIDQIQIQPNLTLQDKACRALHIFIAETDLRNWKLTLMRGLAKARRNDLRILVEDLLSRT